MALCLHPESAACKNAQLLSSHEVCSQNSFITSQCTGTVQEGGGGGTFTAAPNPFGCSATCSRTTQQSMPREEEGVAPPHRLLISAEQSHSCETAPPHTHTPEPVFTVDTHSFCFFVFFKTVPGAVWATVSPRWPLMVQCVSGPSCTEPK